MFEKFFIKDYKNINNSKVRNKYGILAAIFGITSNILLFILKLYLMLLIVYLIQLVLLLLY